MDNDSMPEGWEQQAVTASAVALATSVASMAMQVFGMSGVIPRTEDDTRRMLRRVAPDVSEGVIEAARGLVINALMEVERLQQQAGAVRH